MVCIPLTDVIRVIKSRRLRWAVHVARMGVSRGAYRILMGRPEGKRPLGRPGHRSPTVIRVIKLRRWVGHVARVGESRGGYRVFVGRSEEKTALGRHQRRWRDEY